MNNKDFFDHILAHMMKHMDGLLNAYILKHKSLLSIPKNINLRN
jgi:hypothetical protein